VREVARHADGVVVGSTIVKRIAEIGKKANLVADVAAHVKELAKPLRNSR
jgi:tryptophan synthase alpha subunit